MMTQKRLDELKQLFREDGFEISDDAAREVGMWLLERFRAVGKVIPLEMRSTFDAYAIEVANKK